MKTNKRLIATIIELIVGIMLNICGFSGLLDEYWSGMGTALIVISIIQLARQFKYKTNKTYREAVDTERNDERNRYISTKAWSWAGYLFVLIAAVASILFKIIGMEELVPITSGSACLIMILYWLFWMFLRKKY